MDAEILSIADTADGSRTIFNSSVGEFYHSKHGALQESRHVFVKSGLEYLLARDRQNEVSILEVGFGTGLNFMLSADYAKEHGLTLKYTGIEGYPLSAEMLGATGYDRYVSGPVWLKLKENYGEALKKNVLLDECTALHISQGLLADFKSNLSFDLIYFDAFAEIHQPEMWTAEALEISTRNLRTGGVFVTYAITGNLKRTMKSLGFSIEKAPGAPGKREMLRAIKL